HTDPAAVPAGRLGAADLHHPPAPASAADMDLPAGLLLRAHPHHRRGAHGPDQPRRRRPRAGPAHPHAAGRLAAPRGAHPRDRLARFAFYTLQVTPRTDENIDAERGFVVDTRRYADPAIDAEVIRDFSTSYPLRNGQGDRIRTDGDLPVLDVAGAAERSDGATALMLPRHRPTGTSVMKSRARAA